MRFILVQLLSFTAATFHNQNRLYCNSYPKKQESWAVLMGTKHLPFGDFFWVEESQGVVDYLLLFSLWSVLPFRWLLAYFHLIASISIIFQLASFEVHAHLIKKYNIIRSCEFWNERARSGVRNVKWWHNIICSQLTRSGELHVIFSSIFDCLAKCSIHS